MTFTWAAAFLRLFFLFFAASAGVAHLTSPVAAEAPKTPAPSAAPAPAGSQAPSAKPAKPLDTAGLQSQALLSAIDRILKEASGERQAAKKLPERDKFLFPPIWQETKEDREAAVRELLDSALAIVTDAPILQMQETIRQQRDRIAKDKDKITALREKRLEAPESGLMPGIFTETQGSIDKAVAALQEDIKTKQTEIDRTKQDIGRALSVAGVELSKDQLDLLLDSILGGDLLTLVTAFEVAKVADQRLETLVNQSSEDLTSARRYFAMHAALFAMLVEAQTTLIEKIDGIYLVRLDDIMGNIAKTNDQTKQLLQSQSRDDQKKILEANLKAQDTSKQVSAFYRGYLQNQRKLLVESRNKTAFDLQIADNTYETVEESFQLRALMDEAKTSFDALHRLQAPGFEQIFRNENLKREFENLTQKLGPTS